MRTLTRTQLMSLIQATNKTDIPLSVMKYWFVVYGKDIPKKEVEEVEQNERRT